MTRLKKNVPRKGDIYFDKRFPSLVFVFTRFNREYGLFEFEYTTGVNDDIYTCGYSGYDLSTQLYTLKV